MLNWLLNGRGNSLKFLSPEGAESGGGSSGAKSGGEPAVEVDTLFAGIPLDELDDKTKQILAGVKKSVGEKFATLQSKDAEFESVKKQARDFQSQKDKLQQQLDVLTGGKEPAKDDYLTAAQNVLKGQGYNPEQVEKHAPVFAEMLKSHTTLLKKELGRDLGPMAQSVALNSAKDAFEDAQQQDSMGVLQHPEVAERVWKQTQEHVSKGGVANADFVLSLGKIQYVNYIEALRKEGKDLPELFKSNGAPSVNTPFSFPNAGRMGSSAGQAIVGPARDGNQPKTQLNADTEAALATTFKTMGRDLNVYPEKYKPAGKK